jgi:hypothetical protein
MSSRVAWLVYGVKVPDDFVSDAFDQDAREHGYEVYCARDALRIIHIDYVCLRKPLLRVHENASYCEISLPAITPGETRALETYVLLRGVPEDEVRAAWYVIFDT